MKETLPFRLVLLFLLSVCAGVATSLSDSSVRAVVASRSTHRQCLLARQDRPIHLSAAHQSTLGSSNVSREDIEKNSYASQ